MDTNSQHIFYQILKQLRLKRVLFDIAHQMLNIFVFMGMEICLLLLFFSGLVFFNIWQPDNHFYLPQYLLLLLGVTAFVWGGWYLVRERLSLINLAYELDRRAGLKDQLTTASSLLKRNHNSPFAKMVIDQACEKLAMREVQNQIYPIGKKILVAKLCIIPLLLFCYGLWQICFTPVDKTWQKINSANAFQTKTNNAPQKTQPTNNKVETKKHPKKQNNKHQKDLNQKRRIKNSTVSGKRKKQQIKPIAGQKKSNKKTTNPSLTRNNKPGKVKPKKPQNKKPQNKKPQNKKPQNKKPQNKKPQHQKKEPKPKKKPQPKTTKKSPKTTPGNNKNRSSTRYVPKQIMPLFGSGKSKIAQGDIITNKGGKKTGKIPTKNNALSRTINRWHWDQFEQLPDYFRENSIPLEDRAAVRRYFNMIRTLPD